MVYMLLSKIDFPLQNQNQTIYRCNNKIH